MELNERRGMGLNQRGGIRLNGPHIIFGGWKMIIMYTSSPNTISTDNPFVAILLHALRIHSPSRVPSNSRRVTALKWNTQDMRGLLSIWRGGTGQ